MSTRIIKINRGDSFEFTATIPNKDDASTNYILTAEDALYFAVCHPNRPFEDAIILKGYTYGDQNDDGTVSVKLEPRDTRHLVPGIYYYTTKLKRGGVIDAICDNDDPDEVRTIIERTKFIVND